MSGVMPVRFRPTSKQVSGCAARIGLLASLVAAIPFFAVVVRDDLMWTSVGLLPLSFVTGAVLSAPLVRCGGINLDETGVHPVLLGPARWECAPWHLITDIRAERRGTRTVPVIYLDSGRVWRLRVPYDGMLLAADPHFDEKVCTLRNMWKTYRSRHYT